MGRSTPSSAWTCSSTSSSRATFSLVWDLVVRGTFGYTDWGHRDRTHLRWFTRRDLIELVTEGGWEVVRTSVPPLGRSAALHRATRGRSSEFLVGQIYLTARAA